MYGRGYTLIELVLVIILIGVLSAISLPKFFSVSGYKQNFYFHEVKSSIRYAQKLAVASSCHIQVATSANSLNIKRRTGSDCKDTTSAFTVDVIDPSTRSGFYVRNSPDSSVTISPAVNTIYFDALGRAYNSATNLVTSYTLSIGGRSVDIVGETGLTYEN